MRLQVAHLALTESISAFSAPPEIRHGGSPNAAFVVRVDFRDRRVLIGNFVADSVMAIPMKICQQETSKRPWFR
jgi:hypothetical protein